MVLHSPYKPGTSLTSPQPTEGAGAATEEEEEEGHSAQGGMKLPSAYAILFGLIALVAAATYVVPAGAFTRVLSEALGKEVAVPGTYRLVPAAPQGLVAVFLAPVHTLTLTLWSCSWRRFIP